MPIYRVLLTREVTESVSVTVHADCEETAEELAIKLAGQGGCLLTGWEDDETVYDIYATDVEENRAQAEQQSMAQPLPGRTFEPDRFRTERHL